MPMYNRAASTDIEVIDDWPDGLGWIAHPSESARRASHAVRGADGVWVFDPLDGPGVADALDELGSVAGVAVLSNYHTRDAATFAERHGVAVHIPAWMDRVADLIDAPIERYEAPPGEWVELGDSGITVQTVDPTTAWREAVAYREADGTLLVSDMLGTSPGFTLEDERLSCYLLHRFAPPREVFESLEPDRVLVGHGEGIHEGAEEALQAALDDARRNLPRAIVSQGPFQVRAVIGALRG